jgi:UrcA family protein
MSFITSCLTATAAVSILAGSLALPAVAAEAPAYETRIALVSTGGLDLGTPQGSAELNKRVHAAISSLCGAPDMDDARQLVAVRKCRAGAWAATQPQIQAAIENATRVASLGKQPTVLVSSTVR